MDSNTSSEDTPPSESKELLEIISNLTLDQRAQRFFNFWNFTRELQWAGIKMRNPEFTEDEIDSRFREMMMEHYRDMESHE